MSSTIADITARQILDSRRQPTVEVEVELSGHILARAAVPSGKSTGSHEAVELRDNDDTKFAGKGVLKAVANILDVIRPQLIGLDPAEQANIDHMMLKLDGTPNKAHLGANAMLAVSLAVCRAAATMQQLPLHRYISDFAGPNRETVLLPVPFFNVINGGQHASSGTDIQEFMIAPIGASSFNKALQMGAEVFYQLKDRLAKDGLSTNVGDEGGFVLSGQTNKQVLELLCQSIEAASYQPGKDVALALDVAASEFYNNGHYELKSENKHLEPVEMIEWLASLIKEFPIISIEDGLAEDAWDDWQALTAQLGRRVQLVGDDLLATNPQRVGEAIERKAANAVLVKPNQIGTITETISTTQMAQKAGWATMMSHRSGETEDTSIVHLAVGLAMGQIKAGSLARGERIAKYNELLRIEEEVDNPVYAGQDLQWPI